MIEGIYCCKEDGYWVFSKTGAKVFLFAPDAIPKDDPEIGDESPCWYNEERREVKFENPN